MKWDKWDSAGLTGIKWDKWDKWDSPRRQMREGDNGGDEDTGHPGSACCGPLASVIAVHGSIMALPLRAVHRTMVRVVKRIATPGIRR